MSAWEAPREDAIYSLSFFDQPPHGMYVRAISYAMPVDRACEVFSREQYLQASSDRDDWVLLLQVSSCSVGTFQVGPADSYGGEPSAQVLVKHIVHGREVERHTGLSGAIVVTATPPTMESQLAGSAFVAQGTVEFSESESLQQGCSVGGAVDASTYESTCYCLSADVGSFTCPGVVSEPSCCIAPEAARRSFFIALSAAPCANACLASDLRLRSYCRELGAAGSSL